MIAFPNIKVFKVILACSCLFVFAGCEDKISISQQEYNNIVADLKVSEASDVDLPFTVTLQTEVLVDEIRYTLAVSDVDKKISNLKLLAYHDYPTQDVFPSIGIFDEPVNLEPDGEDKGVILVGYMPYNEEDIVYKLYISYEMDNNFYEVYWDSTN